MTMDHKEWKYAFHYTLPVMAGYLFLGFAFGLLMRTQGFPLWLPPAMSLFIYSGALEYASVPVMAAAFDPISAFVLGIVLSVRHLFYGIPMLKKYAGTGKTKLFLIFGLTDETFSILSSSPVPEGADPKRFYFSVTLLDYSYWVTGTLLGSVFGGVLSVSLEGLDFALTALFIVLLTEQLKTKEGLRSGLIGLLAGILVLMLADKSLFVPLTLAVIIAVLLAGKKVILRE